MPSPNTRNAIGPQVRKRRIVAGINQDELAARCGIAGFEISRSGISHIETGFRGVSDLEMIILARALRINLEDLVPPRLPDWQKDVRSPRAKPKED